MACGGSRNPCIRGPNADDVSDRPPEYARRRVLRAVREASHLDTVDRARVASEAVLETLGEALTGGKAEDAAGQPPDYLASIVEDADHDGAGYDREEFVERVGEHLRGTDAESDDAEQFADGVTDALSVALTEGELEDPKSQLDDDLHPLFEDVTIDQESV